MKLERMDEFFASRADGYDEHMLCDVGGCREGYEVMASLLPAEASHLLDLGCGTGLELDAIFPRHPELHVVGIDLSRAMLDRLEAKHRARNVELICGDYFAAELGDAVFDSVISFQTMHHFAPERKLGLYGRIHRALTPNGCYIECDYMVESEEDEMRLFAECARLRREQGLGDEGYFHFDTPCTIKRQTKLLRDAGFASVEQVFRIENTTILMAKK